MFSQFVFWPWFTGLIFLIVGLFASRRELSAVRGLDKLVALGRVFVACSLATFGAEHLAGARFVVNAVPAWMPARMFWTYFVGLSLIAAASSFVAMKFVRVSAALLALMFFLFVLMIHVPNVVANIKDRIVWAVALRDLAFAGGALAFAASQAREWKSGMSNRLIFNRLISAGRLCVAIPVLVFAVEHFLHPEFAPGVPLPKLTPAWVPLRVVWGYLAGAILLVAGMGLLVNKKPRTAAACIGLLMTVLTVCLYLPILAQGGPPSDLIVGVNYVADTLLFAGTVLVLAAVLPRAGTA